MKQDAKEEMSEEMSEARYTKPNDVFKFLKFMRKEGRDIEGRDCMKDKDGRLAVSEKDRGKLWKEHMEKIMNVENDRNQIVEVDMVEGVTDQGVNGSYEQDKVGKSSWTLRSKYGYNSEWKVRCWSTKEALSESA